MTIKIGGAGSGARHQRKPDVATANRLQQALVQSSLTTL
jgi:hypothetical protein